jgi:hypothetical protein
VSHIVPPFANGPTTPSEHLPVASERDEAWKYAQHSDFDTGITRKNVTVTTRKGKSVELNLNVVPIAHTPLQDEQGHAAAATGERTGFLSGTAAYAIAQRAASQNKVIPPATDYVHPKRTTMTDVVYTELQPSGHVICCSDDVLSAARQHAAFNIENQTPTVSRVFFFFFGLYYRIAHIIVGGMDDRQSAYLLILLEWMVKGHCLRELRQSRPRR